MSCFVRELVLYKGKKADVFRMTFKREELLK